MIGMSNETSATADGEEASPKLTEIDLNGHCPFCLKKLESDRLNPEPETESVEDENGVGEANSDLLDNNRGSKQLDSLNFLWPYLRVGERAIFSTVGTKIKIPVFSFVKLNQNEERGSTNVNVPPMCRSCLEEVKILKGVHEDLIMIRNTMREQVKRIQGIILSTENSQTEFGKHKFEQELRNSSRTSEECFKDTMKFLEFIRSGIIKRELSETGKVFSGPVYPLTSCELLFPVESPMSSIEDETNHSKVIRREQRKAAPDFPFPPEVKIELLSDAEEGDVEAQREKRRLRRTTTEFNQSLGEVDSDNNSDEFSGNESDLEEEGRQKSASRKRKKYQISEYSDEEEEEQEEKDVESDSDYDDPEFTVDEEAMDISSESDNHSDSDVPTKDPLAEINSLTSSHTLKQSSPKKGQQKPGIGSPFEIGTKRGRGRPRKQSINPKVTPPTSPRGEDKTAQKETPDNSTVNVFKTTRLILSQKNGKRSRTYLCDLCPEPAPSFSFEVGLVRHKVEEHQATPLKCKTCSETFYTPRTLFCHEKRMHPETTPDPKRYICDLCDKPFCSRFYVEQHKKVVHQKEKPYECKFCDKRFTNQLGRNLHIRAFHLKEKYECSDCSKIFRYRHLFDRHQETQHRDNPEVIERLKAKEERLKYDTRIEKKGRPPKMPTPTNATAPDSKDEQKETSELVQSSESTKGNPVEGRNTSDAKRPKQSLKYRCDLCPTEEYFFTESSLLLHKHKKHGEKIEKSLRCRVCSQVFLTPRTLQYHQRTYHPDIEPDPIKIPCDQCDKTFSAMFALRIHQRVVHENEKLFECKDCKKTFQNAMGLRFHVKSIHLGVRYSCDICGKQYKYESAIKRHKISAHKIQFGKKKSVEQVVNYQCNLCQPPEKAPTFLKDDSLQNHLIIHHGADPYHCPSCEKIFYWRKSMLKHIKLEHSTEGAKEQPKEKRTYTCEHCGKLYMCKDNLKLHLNKMHDPEWTKKLKPWTCEICGKTYLQKTGYKSHMKMQHRSTTEHICHVCGQTFRNPHYLKRHMQNHTNTRIHQCPHCPGRFKRKDTRDKHIKYVHNRVKQRNVGIRRMHFLNLDSDSSMPPPTTTAPSSSISVPVTSVPSSTPAPSFLPMAYPEVKEDANPREIVQNVGTTPATMAGPFQTNYGYGFMNL